MQRETSPDGRFLTWYQEIRGEPAVPRIHPLKGAGSDRRFYRLEGDPAWIWMESPPETPFKQKENEAYYALAVHLKRAGIPVPEILGYLPSEGWFLLEDLGATSLCDWVKNRKEAGNEEIFNRYREVLHLLIRLQQSALKGFDPKWCCDTTHYTWEFALERESLYFISAFVKGQPGMDNLEEGLLDELKALSGLIERETAQVFIHRDFQSQNILLSPRGPALVDFQGGRIGPPQYDLASLLLDPCADLTKDLVEDLLAYYLEQAKKAGLPLDWDAFMENYRVISFHRNLQVLGAYGFLSGVKKKKEFLKYIPAALRRLKTFPGASFLKKCPKTTRLLERLGEVI
jgi:aminoglycoside/choline kinase family phosphotransferase